MSALLEISGLCASVGEREILRGVDLAVGAGEVHAVMGPNGSGKSTLSHVLMGKPGYTVTGGSVRLDGVEMLGLPTHERARAGLFLAMQYPIEVPGVSLDAALTQALADRGQPADGLIAWLSDEAERLGLDARLLHRALNVDLSGGERKRNETLQLAVLGARVAILDEIDSGLDVDALRQVSGRVETLTGEGLGVLAITHYTRLFSELRPDRVHVLVKGRIVASGGPEVADRLEADGYGAFGDPEPAAVSAPAADPFADPFA